jgi:regulator of nonsense transcripts 2
LFVQLIEFGQDFGPSDKGYDAPGDTFRVRLVAAVLETCGYYFMKGSPKRKLDVFLVHFQVRAT